MKRERAVFESIDIQQEIDFGALEDYIKENLLNDFKESLCGSNIQKENWKNCIIIWAWRQIVEKAVCH